MINRYIINMNVPEVMQGQQGWSDLQHQDLASEQMEYPLRNLAIFFYFLTWMPKWLLLSLSFQGVEPTGACLSKDPKERGKKNKLWHLAVLPRELDKEQTL